MSVLEASKTGDHNAIAYHHRLKELAKVLAVLDPQDSADLITDIAQLPTRYDGWIRVALLEALVFAGIELPEGGVAAIRAGPCRIPCAWYTQRRQSVDTPALHLAFCR